MKITIGNNRISIQFDLKFDTVFQKNNNFSMSGGSNCVGKIKKKVHEVHEGDKYCL